MDCCILTDTHMGIKNSNKFWLDLTYNLFEEITDYCAINNVNKIVHLGDWFNSRYTINVLSIEMSYKIAKLLKDNDITLYIVKGNHDQYFKNKPKPHSLMLFDKYDNVVVIDEPMEFDDEIICPWGEIPIETDKKILIGHYEIGGIITNASGHTLDNTKLSIGDFSSFQKVYSGHFHTKSITSNIHYIGSTFPMSFNDVNDSRGYYHYDSGELVEFIEYMDAPKFKQFTTADDFSKIDIKGNICKLIFLKSFSDKGSIEIIDKVKQYEPKELHLNFKIDDGEVVEEEAFIGTNSEIMSHYIENVVVLPEGLKKNIVKSYVKTLEKDIA